MTYLQEIHTLSSDGRQSRIGRLSEHDGLYYAKFYRYDQDGKRSDVTIARDTKKKAVAFLIRLEQHYRKTMGIEPMVNPKVHGLHCQFISYDAQEVTL